MTRGEAYAIQDAILKLRSQATDEEAIEFIADDELIEVTPKSIRLRKRILNTELRLKAQSKLKKEQQG